MSTETRIDEELVARWIEPNPHRPEPAEAWVLPRCVSVWTVIGQLQLEHWKPEGVADGYGLPLEAIQAAIVYYYQHRTAVDDRIAANRAFFGK